MLLSRRKKMDKNDALKRGRGRPPKVTIPFEDNNKQEQDEQDEPILTEEQAKKILRDFIREQKEKGLDLTPGVHVKEDVEKGLIKEFKKDRMTQPERGVILDSRDEDVSEGDVTEEEFVEEEDLIPPMYPTAKQEPQPQPKKQKPARQQPTEQPRQELPMRNAAMMPQSTDEPNSKMKDVDYRKTDSFFSIARLKKKFNMSFRPDKVYLINMELNNGFHTTFIVTEKESGFKYNGKKYIFDDALKYFHLPSGLFAFNYHEGFALPILSRIDLNEIQKAVSGSGITEIEYMTNPTTLERFTVSKIAEGIMKGQQLDAFFRQIRLLVIINLLISFLNLVLFVAKTGMLKAIKIPGL
jgi:hypothetical protein